MTRPHCLVATILLLACAAALQPAAAAPALSCGPFTQEPLPPAVLMEAPYAVQRANRLSTDIKTTPYRALFFGESLTEGWPPQLWQQHLGLRGVLNAAVAGESSEHLRWHLDHGFLAGPTPQAVIVLIGTNDLGQGRTPQLAAEGIRAVLSEIREKVPSARILLLGLYPRGWTANDPYRLAAAAVNRLIQTCGDGGKIVYRDIGGVVLDPQGQLTHAMSIDGLHFTAAGYERLAPPLDAAVDHLLAAH